MIRFTLNGEPVEIDAAPDRSLARILRDDLGRTGTKIGCDIGRCGACTVLLGGQAVNACLVIAWRLAGQHVTTIEGLDSLPVSKALVQGMTEANAFQCGYCAPGTMMQLAALLTDEPEASDDTIRAALEGNLCRCTGYHSILRGARRAADLLRAETQDKD
ncbi:(2Fe-2S)-binding protein [Rhodobacter sp. NTK016B]|uniref:(2Fe-2S)-binding protein n=1 Tax=Rhodobacter sp. NTK016B TaxID=2759676 RepID=UPI001A8F9656|nr:(2Fe-2S)-binding protein [Rhodobacter sp. NTK016B]MBN8293681.1 (2Fe-2S)-binding protein [Rhodobacter sp. NTK016B]